MYMQGCILEYIGISNYCGFELEMVQYYILLGNQKSEN